MVAVIGVSDGFATSACKPDGAPVSSSLSEQASSNSGYHLRSADVKQPGDGARLCPQDQSQQQQVGCELLDELVAEF